MKGKVMYVCVILLCAVFFSDKCAAQNNSSDSVYNMVDTKPVFPGDLHIYMNQNIHYPQTALNNGTEGIVFVSFVITKTGKVTDVKVEKGVSTDLDDEAFRLIKNMPDWTPGKMHGVAVNVRIHLPISFIIRKPNNDTLKVPGIAGNFGTRLGFYITPYAGVGPGTVVTNVQFGLIGGGLGIGGIRTILSGGASMGYMVNNYVGFSVGAQVQRYYEPFSYTASVGTIGTYVDTIVHISLKYYFNYLDVPLLFEFISSKPGHVGLHLEAGFLWGIPIGASETGTISRVAQVFPHTYNNPFASNMPTNTTLAQQNYTATPVVYSSDNGLVFNFGLMIPFSNRLSLAIDIATVYKFSTSIGNGSNDKLTYSNVSYQYFSGEYGEANAFLVDFKLFIHLGRQGAKKL